MPWASASALRLPGSRAASAFKPPRARSTSSLMPPPISAGGSRPSTRLRRALGIFFAHDRGGAALVRRVGIGMDQTNADRINAGIAEETGGGAHALLVQRAQ